MDNQDSGIGHPKHNAISLSGDSAFVEEINECARVTIQRVVEMAEAKHGRPGRENWGACHQAGMALGILSNVWNPVEPPRPKAYVHDDPPTSSLTLRQRKRLLARKQATNRR